MGPKAKEVKTSIVSLGLELKNGGRKILSLSTIDYMTKSTQVARVSESDYSSLRNCTVLDIKTVRQSPRVLIGADYFFEFFRTHHSLPSGFTWVDTTLGPVLVGRGWVDQGRMSGRGVYSSLDVDQLWDLDSIGIRDSPDQKDDELALEQFWNSMTRDKNGRYSVGFPWKEESPDLSDNQGIAFGRLKSVLEKFQGNKDILRQYDETFREQLKLGIIEVAPRLEQSNLIHFFPHQAVVTPHKNTTKTRIVFDASCAKKGARSLNDCLLRGPVILPQLVEILLRWRNYHYILLADIEKAFLQIGLNEPDREVTRFWWVKDIYRGLERDNAIVYRYCRVPFGVISSPFLLAAVLRHHLSTRESPIAPKMLENLYVDIVILATDDWQEARGWYREVKRIFESALMNIREFSCNVPEFQSEIPKSDRCLQNIVSVLGIPWDIAEDFLVMRTHPWNFNNVTKRTVVKFMQGHFDPLGFLAPVMVNWKIFCQSLWKNKMGWDDKFTPDLLESFEGLLSRWQSIDFRINRLASTKKIVDFHLFVDASKAAYCACIFARCQIVNGFESKLIFAKSRVTPLKGITIPRAELLAALIGVRAIKFLQKALRLEAISVVA